MNFNLKAAREFNDMTQEMLAKRLGVSRQTIVAIEKGRANPSLKLCLKICKTLGYSLDEIFWE